MKINWRVRFKNPVFIAQIIMAILAPIMAYMGLSGSDIASWSILGHMLLEAVKNPYVLAMVVVSVWNAINDPTTAGVDDSKHALQYSEPFEGGSRNE